MNLSKSLLDPNPYAVQKKLTAILEKRNISEPIFTILIIIYSFLVILGITGNFLVIYAAFQNRDIIKNAR